MKHKKTIILIAVVLFIGIFLKLYCYKTSWDVDPNEQYTKYRNAWPSANGVVLDAETKKPIVGAKVEALGKFEGFLGHGSTVADEITQTDDQGRYKIPRLSYFGYVSMAMYELVIYKAGYVIYDSHWPFKGTIRQKFIFKDNVVLLEKWDDKKYTPHDHVDHVQAIGCANLNPVPNPTLPPSKGVIFCREAREEMILGCIESEKYTRDHCEKLVSRNLGEKQ